MKRTLILLAPIVIIVIALWSTGSNSPFLNSSKEELSISFTSYVHQVSGVKRLQLVEITSNEIIERTSEFSLFWNMIKLPDMVVLARIPTTYTYYIDLEEPLSLESVDGKVRLKVSDLRASMPAADISGISFEVKEGSLFRDTRKALEDLRKTITPALRQKAELNKALAYEKAKEELKGIAKAWAKKDFNSNLDEKDIEVLFQDQTPISNKNH